MLGPVLGLSTLKLSSAKLGPCVYLSTGLINSD